MRWSLLHVFLSERIAPFYERIHAVPWENYTRWQTKTILDGRFFLLEKHTRVL